VAVEGDMGDPEAILAHPGIRQAGLRLDLPACVILCCVLHFLDAETARDLVARFARVRRHRPVAGARPVSRRPTGRLTQETPAPGRLDRRLRPQEEVAR